MKNWPRKLCIFLCSILFEVTYAIETNTLMLKIRSIPLNIIHKNLLFSFSGVNCKLRESRWRPNQATIWLGKCHISSRTFHLWTVPSPTSKLLDKKSFWCSFIFLQPRRVKSGKMLETSDVIAQICTQIFWRLSEHIFISLKFKI